MNVSQIVETICDRIMGQTVDDPKHSEAEATFRAAVADFIGVLDPRRGTRVNGDVLRRVGHELYVYASVIDPKGERNNLREFNEQARRVVRGLMAEELLNLMEVLSDDRLASASARKLLADHLKQGGVPGEDAMSNYRWPVVADN